jgi:imidazoleglycerol-phosphate dehydratase
MVAKVIVHAPDRPAAIRRMLTALDISGRAYLVMDAEIPSQKVGDFDTELVREFMYAFAQNARLTLHFKKLHENSHHLIEAMFKGLGRALREAVSIEEAHRDEIPSSKGVL